MRIQRWLLGLALVAFAATARADDTAAAREHSQRGDTLYDLQHFAEAAKEYEAAYQLKPIPDLLFNLAQAYRYAGDYNRAIVSFRAFLRRVPHHPAQKEAEARIRDMQRMLEQQKRHEDEPPSGTARITEWGGAAAPDPRLPLTNDPQLKKSETPTANNTGDSKAGKSAEKPVDLSIDTAAVKAVAPPDAGLVIRASAPPPRSRARRIAGFTVGALGIAALAVGVGLAVSAHNLDQQFTRAQVPAWDDDAGRRGAAEQSGAISLFTVGGVSVATGAMLVAIKPGN
jgi:hypothetical protein